ncbi:MAG: Gfo/Idh/MocA family oxidoreductase [Chloroflexi bacterium]|nr:Gfo/Idh/MocA family oxidoreductase [Chloroflexota bacterium]
MSKPLNVGVIGCGARARLYCEAAHGVPGLKLQAYADVRPDAVSQFLADFGGAYATADAARVLSDPDLQAVFICTWHDTHTAYAVQAARNGKHLLIEKPMALTIDECWQIEEAVAKAGVTACVGLKMRFMPVVRRVRQLVGPPLLLVGQMMNNRVPDDIWSLQPVIGGGTVLGAGCHTADLLCYLAGSDPIEVFAAGGHGIHQRADMVDNVVATIKFANGVVASLVHGDPGRNPYTSTFFCEVFGADKGACLYDRFHQATLWGVTPARLGVADMGEAERSDLEGDQTLLRHFADSALNGTPCEADARAGRIATTTMVKILDSIRTGQPQQIEADWRNRYD